MLFRSARFTAVCSRNSLVVRETWRSLHTLRARSIRYRPALELRPWSGGRIVAVTWLDWVPTTTNGSDPLVACTPLLRVRQSFRSSVSMKRVIVSIGDEEDTWSMYDYGPKSVTCPVIFLAPVSGSADIFYKQLMSLGSQGYRCIAVRGAHPGSLIHFCLCMSFLLLTTNHLSPNVRSMMSSMGRCPRHSWSTQLSTPMIASARAWPSCST